MFVNENEYDIRKKYCPALRKNVIVKVYYGKNPPEECTEAEHCRERGGCRNEYLHSSERASHSL